MLEIGVMKGRQREDVIDVPFTVVQEERIEPPPEPIPEPWPWWRGPLNVITDWRVIGAIALLLFAAVFEGR